MLNNNLEPADEYARVKANTALKYIQNQTGPQFAGIAKAIVDIEAFLESIPNSIMTVRMMDKTEPAVVKPPSNIVSMKGRNRGRNIPTSNGGGLWTAADDKLLVELVGQGVRNDELARQFGRSSGAISCRLSILEVDLASRPRGRKHSHNVPTIYGNTGWTSADEDLILGMHLDGYSHRKIAKSVGRSMRAVSTRLGLIKNRKPVTDGI